MDVIRVIFTGSRNWTGVPAEMKIQNVMYVIYELTRIIGQPFVVRHGAHDKGADKIVDSIARRWKEKDPTIAIERYLPLWDIHGRAAGPIRNQLMVDHGSDMCVGFPKGISKGTRHCMSLARNAGIFTVSIEWDLSWGPIPSEEMTDEQIRRSQLSDLRAKGS